MAAVRPLRAGPFTTKKKINKKHKSHTTESEALPISDRVSYGRTTGSGDLTSKWYGHTRFVNRRSCTKGKGEIEGISVPTS
jgi:hypothetical protein